MDLLIIEKFQLICRLFFQQFLVVRLLFMRKTAEDLEWAVPI